MPHIIPFSNLCRTIANWIDCGGHYDSLIWCNKIMCSSRWLTKWCRDNCVRRRVLATLAFRIDLSHEFAFEVAHWTGPKICHSRINQASRWCCCCCCFHFSHIATVLPSALSPRQIKSPARVAVGVSWAWSRSWSRSRSQRQMQSKQISAIMSRTWNWVGCGQGAVAKGWRSLFRGTKLRHRHRVSGIGIVIDISTAQRWRTFTRTNSVNFYCDFLEPKTRAAATTTQAESACTETR